MITASKNDFIKHIKKLQSKKSYRFETGLFVLEGLRLVKDGIKNVQTVILSESEAEKEHDFLVGKDIKVVSEKVFSEISETKSPQGIMAVSKMCHIDLKDITTENAVIVYCNRVSDPGNLGTIIRTADAAGCDAVILEGCVDLYNPKTVRSTMSSLFNVPLAISDGSVADFLKSKNVQLIGTSPAAQSLLYEEKLEFPTAVVIGNEANGIDDELLLKCDRCIKIPMFGKAESLNASVAAALCMYDAVMQRQKRR